MPLSDAVENDVLNIDFFLLYAEEEQILKRILQSIAPDTAAQPDVPAPITDGFGFQSEFSAQDLTAGAPPALSGTLIGNSVLGPLASTFLSFDSPAFNALPIITARSFFSTHEGTVTAPPIPSHSYHEAFGTSALYEIFFGDTIATYVGQNTLFQDIFQIAGDPLSYVTATDSGDGHYFLVQDGGPAIFDPILTANYRIYAGAGNDWIIGGSGDDVLYGEDGNDWLRGGGGNDILYGGDGIDRLEGGSGNNTLYGGDGDDLFIIAGGGEDRLYGGNGQDTFVYKTLDHNVDLFFDFDANIGGDTLRFGDILVGYNYLTSAINDFIMLSTAANGIDTQISVSASGNGVFEHIATIVGGVGGQDLNTLFINNAISPQGEFLIVVPV